MNCNSTAVSRFQIDQKKKLRWIPSIQPLFWSFGIYHFLIHFIFFSQGSIKLHSQAWAALSTGALASSTSTTTWARRTPPSCLGETFAMEPGTHLENMAIWVCKFLSFSLTFTARLVGPTLGFLLGSACLGTYVYPGMEVGYQQK